MILLFLYGCSIAPVEDKGGFCAVVKYFYISVAEKIFAAMNRTTLIVPTPFAMTSTGPMPSEKIIVKCFSK